MAKPIEKPDTTNTSAEYWEKVLCSHNLSAERASRPRIWTGRGTPDQQYTERTTLVGGSRSLEKIEVKRLTKRLGHNVNRGASSGDDKD